MPAFNFLPPEIPAESVVACIGLMSDTYMPQRCATLPDMLAEVFAGADLILHAGDLGELWVLDRISRLAPLLAVHGNDETADAQRELPYQQVITVAGERIVLCHSHYPIRAEEMESRRDDAWRPKLDRLAGLAQRAGGSILVYGHSHIPMAYEHAGVLLINPGAIASGSAVSRQLIQTVALLFIREDSSPVVVHVDLASPSPPFGPEIDLAAGFKAAMNRYNASILDADMADCWQPLSEKILSLLDDPADRQAFFTRYDALLIVSHRCWAGEKQSVTRADLHSVFETVRGNPRVPANFLAELMELMA